MPAPEGNQYAAGNEGGRPTKYRTEYAKQVKKLCRLGATDKEIADFFEVAESTINEWKQKQEEFSESIKKGKLLADANVADSLYRRAIGYQHPDTYFSTYEGTVTQTKTVKYYPPDTTAAIFWLKNRQKGKWRDKQEHALMNPDDSPMSVVIMVPDSGRLDPLPSSIPPATEPDSFDPDAQ